MIDLEQEDKRLINDALQKFTQLKQDSKFPSLLEILEDVVSKKNEVFSAICKERLEEKIDSIAQEKAKDINGIPMRVMLAKDFAIALLNKNYNTVSYTQNEQIAKLAVDLTDTLIGVLKNDVKR